MSTYLIFVCIGSLVDKWYPNSPCRRYMWCVVMWERLVLHNITPSQYQVGELAAKIWHRAKWKSSRFICMKRVDLASASLIVPRLLIVSKTAILEASTVSFSILSFIKASTSVGNLEIKHLWTTNTIYYVYYHNLTHVVWLYFFILLTHLRQDVEGQKI